MLEASAEYMRNLDTRTLTENQAVLYVCGYCGIQRPLAVTTLGGDVVSTAVLSVK